MPGEGGTRDGAAFYWGEGKLRKVKRCTLVKGRKFTGTSPQRGRRKWAYFGGSSGPSGERSQDLLFGKKKRRTTEKTRSRYLGQSVGRPYSPLSRGGKND